MASPERIQDSEGPSASGEIMSPTFLDRPGFHHCPPCRGGVHQGPLSLVPLGILTLCEVTLQLPHREAPSLVFHRAGNRAQPWMTQTKQPSKCRHEGKIIPGMGISMRRAEVGMGSGKNEMSEGKNGTRRY